MYTKVAIKQTETNVIKTSDRDYIYQDTAIHLYDTRGQILLDENEKEHLNLLIDVIFILSITKNREK